MTKRIQKRLALALVLLLLAASAGCGGGTKVPAGSNPPEGYQLVWQDDFSGGSEALKDSWRFEDWAPGRVNHELQRYVPDDRRTSYVQDGALHIVARKDGSQVISARMNSTATWRRRSAFQRAKAPGRLSG